VRPDAGHGLARGKATTAQLGQLIRLAFEQARTSGKSGTEMNDAVLKNRLLLITDRRFNESSYGSTSFLALLRSLPELIDVIGDRPPYKVRLLPDTAMRAAIHAATPDVYLPVGVPVDQSLELVRVRPDLWSAIVDYVTRGPYLWDSVSKEVVRVEGSSTQPLPTMTRDDFNALRLDFARTHRDDAFAQRWVGEGGSIHGLPYELRTPWTTLLKKTVIDRLRGWFKSNELDEPADLLQPARNSQPTKVRVQATSELRELVLRIVAGMTETELASLALPASAVARQQQL